MTASFLTSFSGFMVMKPVVAYAASSQQGEQTSDAVDLEAEHVTHDDAAQIVTATGNVELVQNGRILKADKVIYNLATDRVRAEGNVVMTEPDGTTYFVDEVELTDDMKDGFVNGLQVLLNDGSRFTAHDGTRTRGTVIELKEASYTPCEPCKNNPERAPLWQLSAAEVTHDKTQKRVSYRDAWFEFMGVPLAYTPYFSHPDGSEKQKSGFLVPKFGYDSDLGAVYQQQYYWAIAPDKDATVGTMVMTSRAPVAFGEYRQRFENAEMNVSGSATYSSRTDSSGGVERYIEDEERGHLFADARWDMSDTWRSGMRVNVASDDQYLNQYNISSEDILENEVYAERFSGRNYTSVRALAFQDIRVTDTEMDQPAVFPEIYSSFYGDPNGLLGGRWNAALSATGLYRDGSEQDVGRTSVETSWQKRLITGFGLVNTFDALLRADGYQVYDRAAIIDADTTQARGFAQGNWEVSYPFVRSFQESQVTVSPVASLTAGSSVDNNEAIPNEDSQDFSLDSTNLFEPNRFAGYDRIEDGQRVTYGGRVGYYDSDANKLEAFLGQSYNFSDNGGLFSQGSGLSEQKSDYVGKVSALLGGIFNLDYGFQLGEDDLSSRRHELDTSVSWDRYLFGARYLFSNALEDTSLDATREQILPYARYRFYEDWYMFGAAAYDLGEYNDESGLRYVAYGLDYTGQCATFTMTAERRLTSESSGDSGTEIMFRIGLKNLGEFQTSGISLGGGGDSNSEDATDTLLDNATQ